MFALNYLTLVLIFTVVVSGSQNGEQYQADSNVERLPEIQAAAMIDKNTIDETATNRQARKINVARAHENTTDVDGDENHASGHVDATQKKFAPKFKHPSKMFDMDMKPVGSSIRLRCAADGNPKPNITWSKNNAPIVRRYFQPSYGKWSMSLDELTKSDEGNYTCLVCNELGCISHTVALLVQERLYSKPVLTRGADNQTKLVGETAHFTCEFNSDMHSHIFWKRLIKDDVYDSNVTSSNHSVIITSDDPNDGPEKFTIFNVTKEHEGWYVCNGMNVLGVTSTQGYLTVLDSIPVKVVPDYSKHTLERYPTRPSIKEGYPGNKTAFVHGTVRLTCPILSNLQYFSYWLKPAKNYIGNSHVGAEELPEGLVIQSDDDSDKPEVLTLYNVTKEKRGWYVCVALNTLGRASAKGYLTVLDRNNHHN